MTREIEEKLRKLAPVSPTQAALAWQLYLAGEGRERDETNELVDLLLAQLVEKNFERGIFLDPPPRESCSGEYALGHVLYPPGQVYAPFGLDESDWTRHLLIVGMTGTGKTTLTYHLLHALLAHGKPALVFDWKQNYRQLLQFPAFRNLAVYTVGRKLAPFHFNPLLPPPSVSAGEWLMKLVDVMKHAYFVGEGVEYLLRRGLDHVYRETGYHDGSRHTTPLITDLRMFVLRQRLQGRMSLWKASALRVLESLCFPHGLGPVLNTTHTLTDTFLARTVILELDMLADADKIFLTEAMILWLYEHRKTRGTREEFSHALVIEEGHHILSEHKERSSGGETIMETALRQIREFGESVIVIDQEPSKLSNSIKANAHTRIAFQLSNGRDIRDMAACLGLNRDDREYLHVLRTGHALAVHPRVSRPVHVHFPHVAVDKNAITDKEIKERKKDLLL